MLPGRRRLQQGTRNSPAANRTGTANGPTDEPVELPPYQPQACPLAPESEALLASLFRSSGTAKLEVHIRDSLTSLTASTAALSATLQSSRYQVENMSEKKEAEKARLERELAKLEEKAKALTGDAEGAVRGLVDLKGEIEDEKVAFEQAKDVTSTGIRERQRERESRLRERRELAAENGEDVNGAGGDEMLLEEEENGAEVQPVSELIKGLQDRKAENYVQMSMYQRYALNNDYADFKRQWHNGLHGEDAVLPDAKRWFSAEGHPIFNFGRSHGEEGDDENLDGDTDLIVERATVSTRCPLSLQEMVEPFANRRCKHVFEKGAIMEYIGRQGRVTCPQSGCHVVGFLLPPLTVGIISCC